MENYINEKYNFRKEGTKPQLELETTSGALLSDEDPLSLLFPLGALQAEPVIGKIVKMSLPPLVDRYKEACTQMDTGKKCSTITLLQINNILVHLGHTGFQSK